MDSCFAPVVLNFKLNLSPPMSDQDRISPYNANTISSRYKLHGRHKGEVPTK